MPYNANMGVITDKQGIEWLINKLDNAGNGFRNTDLYKLLKDRLSYMGYWKAKERGNAKKGYIAMINRTNNTGAGIEYYDN